MHTGRNYSLREILAWTRRELVLFVVVAIVPTILYSTAHWTWLAIPWVPVALLGTAVAFLTGFKNNASYARLWEARQVWGGLVNTSRYWGTQVCDFLAAPADSSADVINLSAIKQRLIYRHIAFLTALRYQLREPRSWETMRKSHNVEYQRYYVVAEWAGTLEEELKSLLDPSELTLVLSRKNRATQLLAMQSRDLAALVQQAVITEFQRVFMSQTISRLLEDQGRCERIKNFPYPRQFATLNVFFVWLFVLLLPLGLLPEFNKLGGSLVWMTIPASVILSWVIHTMDKIGESSENPFEGGPNDVPITALCRTIEIDLREMLGETIIPPAIQPTNQILT